MKKLAPVREPYQDEYLISYLVYMKAHLTLIKYIWEWIDEFYACATRSRPPTGLFHIETEDLKQQWPEPGCSPAVFVKIMVFWGCSVSWAQKTWLWSFLFKVYLPKRWFFFLYIHRFLKWPPFKCSFVFIQISPWCLVLKLKFKRIFRLERGIKV